MTNENVWDCRLILKYNNYTYLFNVQNHNKIKSKVLKEIRKTPTEKTPGIQKTNVFVSSDWTVDSSIKRTYWENYVKLLADNCINILKDDLYKDMKQKTQHHNHWFHTYTKNSGFGWHTHGESNFSGIYYVKLKDKKYKTEFNNYDLPIEEGNIIIFPSFLLHRSPLINSKTEKIIVSFNFSLLS